MAGPPWAPELQGALHVGYRQGVHTAGSLFQRHLQASRSLPRCRGRLRGTEGKGGGGNSKQSGERFL